MHLPILQFEGLGFKLKTYRHSSRSYGSIQASVSIESTDNTSTCADEEEEEQQQQIKLITVRDLMRRNTNDDVTSLMKMERRTEPQSNRWFPYFDKFKSGTTFLSSQEVLEAVDPSLMELRKDRFVIGKDRFWSRECLSRSSIR